MKRAAGRKQAGQAILELALAITFIMMLFAASIDLGLAYKTYQTLINAIAEAGSYLDQNPVANCGTSTCDTIAAANANAIDRFRTEQGDDLHNIATTLDLNDNDIDDMDESGGAAFITSMVQITAADNTQIDSTSGSEFAVDNNYDPAATDAQCKLRIAQPKSSNPNVTSCYIVIRAAIQYRPFVLKALLGDPMTIRAINVRRIVTAYD